MLETVFTKGFCISALKRIKLFISSEQPIITDGYCRCGELTTSWKKKYQAVGLTEYK